MHLFNKIKTIVSSEKYPGPGGKMMSISEMKNKASFYSRRFDDSDDLADLQAALDHNTTVVEAAKVTNHSSLASFHETLAVFHGYRYKKTGDRDDLELALENDRSAVEATPAGDPNLPRRYQSLAVSYAMIFRELDNMEALEHALKYHHLAVDLTPEGDSGLLERKVNLSASYLDRFERLGEKEDLESSLNYDLSVIRAVSSDDPELPRYQQSLAVSYMAHFRSFGDIDSLKSSMKWMKLAVESTRPGDSDLAWRQQNLSVCFTRVFQRLGNMDDITLAIEYGKMALDATPPDHHELVNRQQILAMAHSNLFTRTGNLENLERAIQLEQSSVDITPNDDPRLPSRQSNLAGSYTLRFRRLQDLQDLELALKYNSAAVERCPLDHPDLAHHQHALAATYLDRFSMLQSLDDAEKALEYSKAALKNTPSDHADILSRKENLGICYNNRYDALEKIEDLEMAISLKQLVVDKMSKDDPDLSTSYFRLGTAYAQHFLAQHVIGSLELAVLYHSKAAEGTSSDHPNFAHFEYKLGAIYATNYNETKTEDDLDKAFFHLRRATTSSNAPARVWITGEYWGKLAVKHGLPECLEAYSIAFKNLSQLIWIGNSITVRHETLKKYEIPLVAGLAAAASIKFNKPELAVEFLEQGLAITYRQMLQLRDSTTTELMKKHPKLAKRLRDISLYLQQMERSSISSQQKRSETESYHLLAIERNDLIEKIKKLQGFENLFADPTFEYLSTAAINGPVILINCTAAESHAIIVLAQPYYYVKTVSLSKVTLETAKNILDKLKLALEFTRIKSRSPDRSGRKFQQNKQSAQSLFEEVLVSLKKIVIEPVFQALKESGVEDGRIWWCPTGAFTYLPLHAAGAYGPYIQSYTSTLDALIQARKKETPITMSITALGVTSLVGQPHLDLPSVAKELEKIKAIVGSWRFHDLQDSDANVTPVLGYIQKATWLHLACHGEQDLVNPLKSKLLLQDGFIQLDQILAVNLPLAQFVFLSACQTAMGDSELINEAMHMAGAFVAAGFKGAVGTLWSMADIDGPVVAEIFYEKIFSAPNCNVESSAEALKAAVDQLRCSSVPFERWMPFVHFGL